MLFKIPEADQFAISEDVEDYTRLPEAGERLRTWDLEDRC